MKVLIFIDQLEHGGAGRVVSILANGLIKKNHSVVLAFDIQKGISYELSS